MEQTKKIMIGIFGIMLTLAFIGMAMAGNYCFLKLGKGEKAQITTSSYFTCSHTICQICASKTNLWYASYNKCEAVGTDVCSGSGNTTETPMTLSVVYPFSDGAILTKQNFNMNIHTNKIASIKLIDNILGTQKTLCPNCMAYTQSVNFNQGFNNITVIAVKGTSILKSSITFFIDNKKPSIKKTAPTGNSYVNGNNFTVTYDEDNVKEIDLFYGSSTASPNKLVLTGCPSGKGKSCSASLNLNSLDGKTISYWFTVSDIANNLVKSTAVKVYVDVSAPVINSVNYTLQPKSTYVQFNIKVTEKNLKNIVYIDNNAAKAKVLCTSLKNGMCSNRISFSKGHHVLSIQAFDKAGSGSLVKTVTFDV
jgi:hypothetical protein